MNPKQKYFRILGINPTTDKAIIKKAYRKLAFKFHPDVNDSKGAHSKFVELNEAYDILMGIKPISKKRVNSKTQPTQKTNVKSTQAERDERVKAAKARFEKAKQKELEEEANYYLNLISGWKWRFLKVFSIVSTVFALLLIVDYVLPTHNELFVVESLSDDSYGQAYFEFDGHSHYFDYLKSSFVKNYPLIDVHFTPIFHDFKSFSFVNGPKADVSVEPIFCYLYFFPIVIILFLIPLLTILYKKPTPFFSILYKVSFYISPVLFLIICFSNWRLFQIFL